MGSRLCKKAAAAMFVCFLAPGEKSDNDIPSLAVGFAQPLVEDQSATANLLTLFQPPQPRYHQCGINGTSSKSIQAKGDPRTIYQWLSGDSIEFGSSRSRVIKPQMDDLSSPP